MIILTTLPGSSILYNLLGDYPKAKIIKELEDFMNTEKEDVLIIKNAERFDQKLLYRFLQKRIHYKIFLLTEDEELIYYKIKNL